MDKNIQGLRYKRYAWDTYKYTAISTDVTSQPPEKIKRRLLTSTLLFNISIHEITKTLTNKVHPYSEQHFFARPRLIVSAGQGEHFMLIISCHSELPSKGCTFCFQKHPLISSFCQTRRSAEHCSIVSCFAFYLCSELKPRYQKRQTLIFSSNRVQG